jgi:hypothetical protein
LLYDPALSFIGISLKEFKSGYNKDTCTSMFTAALFTATKIWKQSRCFSTDTWIKHCGIYTMEFYSALNKNENLLFAGKWMELRNINLSEISQVKKTKGHMFSLTHGLET